MQLKMSTDYAIRIIMYLAKMGKSSTQQIANDLKISQNYVRKLIRQTELSKFITSIPGVNGGLTLKKKASEISLLDVIQTVEKSSFINICLEDSTICDTCKSFCYDNCPVKKCYADIQAVLDSEYQKIKIDALLTEEFCFKRS